MSAVREVTTICLKQDLSINAQANRDKHLEAMHILLDQPGSRVCLWGIAAEQPSTCVWIVEWDELACHQNFIDKKDVYQLMVDRLVPFLDTAYENPIVVQHVPIEDDVPFATMSEDASLYELFWIGEQETSQAGKVSPQAVKEIKDIVAARGCQVSGSVTVESSSQAVLFLKSWEHGVYLREHSLAQKAKSLKFQLNFERHI